MVVIFLFDKEVEIILNSFLVEIIDYEYYRKDKIN